MVPEDHDMSREEPGTRCAVWGWQSAEKFYEAVIDATLARMTERQADKFLALYAEEFNAHAAYMEANPLSQPEWLYGENDD